MMRLVLSILLYLLLLAPAHAHRLKVFATVTGDTVSGYAFFVGGGRAQGSPWTARDAAGRDIAAGVTDAEGGFRFTLPETLDSALTISVDTQEAHVASVTLSAERLGLVAQPPAGLAAAPTEDAPDTGTAPSDAELAALVEAAIQRQITPVLERIEELDARLRFVDALSAILFIFGLAGVVLWARSRRS